MKTRKMIPTLKALKKCLPLAQKNSKMAILSLLLLFVGFSSFAKSETFSKEKETMEIRKQLYAQIQFPKFLIENNTYEESVNVIFQVEKNGSIHVVRTDSKNEDLNKFISEELAKAKLESLAVNEENIYKINIRFKLL